ncbi:MAG: T9SS type A sorting domain-containing protein, partial [Bacteroidia bacterium]
CDGQYDTFEDFFVASDGSVYLIKGHRLKKLNADWEDEWQYDLELSEHVWLYKMTQFDYGYIIATGDLWINIDDKDIFMCKIALPEAIGIDEEEENDEIRLYPNPANTQLTIQTNINGKSDYFIYDLTGSLLQSGSFIQAKTIDVKGFAEGVYVIQLQTEQGIVSKKFVKQN